MNNNKDSACSLLKGSWVTIFTWDAYKGSEGFDGIGDSD